MKKVFALLLVLVMVIGLCACGDKKAEKSPADQAQDIVNDALENVDVDIDLDDTITDLEDALNDFEIDNTASVAGRYYLSSMTIDGETISVAEYAELLAAEGFEMYIDLEDDGTALMHTNDGTYVEDTSMGWGDGMMWPAEDPTDTAACAIDGQTIIITADDMGMVFEKN